MASQNGTHTNGRSEPVRMGLDFLFRLRISKFGVPLKYVPYRYRRSLRASGGALRLNVLTCEPSEANLLPVIVTTNTGNSTFFYR